MNNLINSKDNFNKSNNNDFIEFEIKKLSNEVIMIHFILKRELEPEDLKKISPPDPIKNNFSDKTIILSGRGPIWLYGFLIHYYHPVKAISIFDPRYNAAIIIESHFKKYKIGDIIKTDLKGEDK
jgi:CRISPR-associated protein Csx3